MQLMAVKGLDAKIGACKAMSGLPQRLEALNMVSPGLAK